MSIKYGSRTISLSDIIKNATTNATYLIPDLQRPYVWTPMQVILLIDSIFRGWPFGAVLLWEVKPDCYKDNEGIPHRPFWQVVDRTTNNNGTVSSTKAQPATYFMVLDGQQRIQSLLLALGGDRWGFKLYDHEWSNDLRDKRLRNSGNWSKASLCLDLGAFKKEWLEQGKKVRRIEVGKILDWVIIDPQHDISSGNRNYDHPLKNVESSSGNYVRLSRLWDSAQNNLPESEYRDDIIRPILNEHNVANAAELEQPLAEFMKTVEAVKNTSFVHSLQIDSFSFTSQWKKEDYNEAIVNIFTRLNTAGRTLTREEITLAWLKVGWVQTLTDDKSAGECLTDLRQNIESNAAGLRVSTDELVRMLSFVWIIQKREGQLLADRDLLQGDVITPMAGVLSEEWKHISRSFPRAAWTLNQRDLIGNSGSFNALIVAWGWLYLADRWLENHKHQMKDPERDSFRQKIDEMFGPFMDRWVFSTQWANTWASSANTSLQSFAKILFDCDQVIEASDDFNVALDGLRRALTSLLDAVLAEATAHVRTFNVTDRTKVSQYRGMLWVWQRLNTDRNNMATIVLRRGHEKKDFIPEVDHAVADAYWKKRVDNEIAGMVSAGANMTVPNGMPEKGPTGFTTKDDAVAFINKLGNCSLLRKGFNISKSDGEMWEILKTVHEFTRTQNPLVRSDWERALNLTSLMTSPESHAFTDIKRDIEDRDKAIREELVEFVAGRKIRQDI